MQLALYQRENDRWSAVGFVFVGTRSRLSLRLLSGFAGFFVLFRQPFYLEYLDFEWIDAEVGCIGSDDSVFGLGSQASTDFLPKAGIESAFARPVLVFCETFWKGLGSTETRYRRSF